MDDIWLLSLAPELSVHYVICPGRPASAELQTCYAYAREPGRVCVHARKDVLSWMIGALTDTLRARTVTLNLKLGW